MDISTIIKNISEPLANNSIIIIISSIITVITSFLFPLYSKRFINLCDNAFDKKTDKQMGIIIFICYILVPIEIISVETIDFFKIENYLIVFIMVAYFIADKEYKKESEKVINNLSPFKPNSRKYMLYSVLVIIILFIVGFINVMILTEDYKPYKYKPINLNIIISLGFKFALFYIPTIILCGYLYGISIINNLKVYTLIGDEVQKLSQKICGINKDEIVGYIVGIDDKEIIFKPYNYNLIRIKKDDIKWIKYNGDVKLKEFAKEYGVKYSTLRSRKNRENWDAEINKNVATKKCCNRK